MPKTYRRPDLSIDQQHALLTAARHLAEEFTGTFGTETIERFLHTSYDQFAVHGKIPNYLPLLAERFARQRLHALARVEGHGDGRPRRAVPVRAQRRTLPNGHGLLPAPGRRPRACLVGRLGVRQRDQPRGGGVDGRAEHRHLPRVPKPWTEEIVRAADVVVTMGCGDACPVYPGRRYLDWELDDPAGKSVEDVRPIRDEIERRVRGLLNDLEVPTA
jgi:arsenate reductase